MKLIIIVISLLSFLTALAKDADQEFKECGLYKVGAKLECIHSDECKLIFSEDALSTKEIQLKKSKYSLGYFKDTYINSDIKIVSIEPKVIGILLAPPVQQIQAIKKDFSVLAEKEVCQ